MCGFSFFVLILYLFLTKKFVFVYFLKDTSEARITYKL